LYRAKSVTFISSNFNIMKRIFLILSVLLIAFSARVFAQTADYKMVFDLTSSDTTDHQSVIRWLNGLSQANPTAKLEVVLYGKSLGMVIKDRSSVAEDVQKLAMNKNINFSVCEGAMKNQKVAKNQLLPGVQTVPDGIIEIVAKQNQGWGYIKAGR
jgi:uncharacterized protein